MIYLNTSACFVSHVVRHRCRFHTTGVQASYGWRAICRFIRREFAQMAAGEFRLFCLVDKERHLFDKRIQRGQGIPETQLSKRKSPSTGL